MKPGAVITLWIGLIVLFAVVLVIDGIVARGIVQQKRTEQFVAVPATILRSEVKVHRGSKSTSYRAEIDYRYTVNGQTYNGSRLRFTSDNDGQSGARALVKQHPVGSQAEAYYDPADPARAVLFRGLTGMDIFPILFLLPFNAMALGGAIMLVDRQLDGRRPGQKIGHVRIWEDGGLVRARLRAPSTGWMFGVATVAGAGMLSMFGMLFAPPRHSIPAVLAVIAAVIVLGLIVGWVKHAAILRGDWDLVFDPVRKSIALPRAKVTAFQTEVSISGLGATAREGPKPGKGKPAWFVDLKTADTPLPGLARFSNQIDAEAFAAWLRSLAG